MPHDEKCNNETYWEIMAQEMNLKMDVYAPQEMIAYEMNLGMSVCFIMRVISNK